MADIHKKSISISLKPHTAEKLKDAAKEIGVSRSALAQIFIVKGLEGYKKKGSI